MSPKQFRQYYSGRSSYRLDGTHELYKYSTKDAMMRYANDSLGTCILYGP